jgi:hypothetical protein
VNPANLTAALDYLLGLLQKHGVTVALHGVYSLFLRGNPRQTHGIDVSIIAPINHILNYIRNDRRQVHHAEITTINF